MQDEFESKGLTVLGVTKESKQLTEPWVKAKKARFPFAYDKGGKLQSALGVGGIPHAFLVAPSGTIVWEGHPASLTAKTIAANLEGVISVPIYAWGGKARKIRKAFRANDFAGALDSAAKLAKKDPLGGEIDGVLRGILAARVLKIETALKDGDALTVYDGAKALSKGLKGLPEEPVIKAALKRIAKDEDLKETLRVQEKLRDIASGEFRKRKQTDAAIGKLEKLMKGQAGTFAGDAIDAKITELQRLGAKLR